MSVMYEVVLIDSFGNTDAVEWVNREISVQDEPRHQMFGRLDRSFAGGTKLFTVDIYAACFNHLFPSIVREAVAKAPWLFPANVFLYEESGDFNIDPRCVSVEALREELNRDQG